MYRSPRSTSLPSHPSRLPSHPSRLPSLWPQGISKLASLKVLQIINCHYLTDETLTHLPSSAKVVRTKEEIVPTGTPRK